MQSMRHEIDDQCFQTNLLIKLGNILRKDILITAGWSCDVRLKDPFFFAFIVDSSIECIAVTIPRIPKEVPIFRIVSEIKAKEHAS